MSIFERLRRLTRGPAVGRETPAEPGPDSAPEDAAEAEYRRLQASVEETRRAIADLVISRKRLETQASDVCRLRSEARARAESAATAGNDYLARSALAEELALERQLGDRQRAINDLAARERQMNESSGRLQNAVESYRLRLETARLRGASADAIGAEAEAERDERRRRLTP